MDSLIIKNLKVYAYHGVFAGEKELGQNFILNLEIKYNMALAAESSDLAKSIHYGILCQEITDWVQESKEDLIESVAWKVLKNIFKKYEIVTEISIELDKPSAPIALPLDYCGVRINRKRQVAFIALGSNLGNKEVNLAQAIDKLREKEIKIIKESKTLVTKAWGLEDQDDFLNQVIEVETVYSPFELLNKLQEVEKEMGRVRHEKWGPRNIDLDLIYFNRQIIYSKELIVPHPYIYERKFVLEPMAEIAPHWIDPIKQKPIRKLLEEIA